MHVRLVYFKFKEDDAPLGILLISIAIRLVFQRYLLLAYIAIPGGAHPYNHDNVSNELAGAAFFSCMSFASPLPLYVAATMYIVHAYVALARLRRTGLILFALHYGFAAVVAMPFYLRHVPSLQHQWP